MLILIPWLSSRRRVSELCLGTMTFGMQWKWGSSKAESRKVYDAFRAAGGKFIDTADLYTNGTSERFLGDFMVGHRGQVVLATKYTLSNPGLGGRPDQHPGGAAGLDAVRSPANRI